MSREVLLWVLVAVALTTSVLARPHRHQLIWAGALSLPVIALIPLPTLITMQLAGLVTAAVWAFSIGVVAAGFYESRLRHRLAPISASRQYLGWAILGPTVFTLLRIFDLAIFESLGVALIVNIAVMITLQAKLWWDFFFAMLAMGGVYALTLLALFHFYSFEGIEELLGSNLSGLTLVGVPVEAILMAIMFGALWGPLYGAVKDSRNVA